MEIYYLEEPYVRIFGLLSSKLFNSLQMLKQKNMLTLQTLGVSLALFGFAPQWIAHGNLALLNQHHFKHIC